MRRRYDFDWLRVFGAVMVVVAHCAGVFNPWAPGDGGTIFAEVPQSKLFGELLWNLNLWLMPLFMLLAGGAEWYALGKRSNREFLRERALHLALPLAVLLITFIIPSAYWMAGMTGKFQGSLPEFYVHYFDGISPDGNFSLFHMWFLVYLLIYTLLTLPLFRFLRTTAGARVIDGLARACRPMGGLYLFALPLVAVQLVLSGVSPQPAFPALVNDWTRFLSLLLAFVFGYILNSDARFQEAIARQWRFAACLALATSAALFALAWPDGFNPYRDLPLDYSRQYAAFWTLFALSSWSWLLAWLGFGQRFLNFDHALRQPAGAASYPIYLLHPLAWIPALFLVPQWHAGALGAFLALTAIVLGGTLALSALCMRWPVTRFLLGLKRGPGGPSAPRLPGSVPEFPYRGTAQAPALPAGSGRA